jgi:hypothetical protein
MASNEPTLKLEACLSPLSTGGEGLGVRFQVNPIHIFANTSKF